MKNDLWFYFYTIKYWDEFSETEAEDCGFVRAISHKDAVSQVSDWYGEDYINSITMKICEDGDGPLTFKILEAALKGFNHEKE